MIIDLSILILFVIYSVSVGLIHRKRASAGLDEYFLAGRSLKGWQAGTSMAATQYAADTPLLVTGLVATAGIFSLWRLWVYGIAFLMMGFLFGACWRRAGVLTDAEFTELRYSGKGAAVLRALKAFHLGTVVNCTVLAMVLLAAARIAEPFLLWHEWLPMPVIAPIAKTLEHFHLSFTAVSPDHADVWLRSAGNLISILLIIGFTACYSMTGGLRSVVATDVVQFSIAMTATFFYAWVVVGKVGGFSALTEKLGVLYGADARHAILSFGPAEFGQGTALFLCVLSVQWFAQVNADGTGYLAQRTMACQTDRDAKSAAVIFTVAQILFRSLLWIPLALGLLVLYPAESLPVLGHASESFRIAREATFASGIRDFLPAGLRGLMLTGMLAALASTIDTHLNWGASYWSNDLYKRFLAPKFLKREASQKELVWAARLSNIGITVIALFIMANLGSIQAAWHLTLLFGSGLGVVLILRWIWYRINLWSEITAAAVSLILSPVLVIFFPELNEGLRLLIMLAVSTAGVIAVTLLTPPEPRETLVPFYQRVRPPGFWKPVAKVVTDNIDLPVRRFRNGVSATLFASLSIFLLLTGVGKLMVRIPGSSLWLPIIFILLGLFLIPRWRRLGMKE